MLNQPPLEGSKRGCEDRAGSVVPVLCEEVREDGFFSHNEDTCSKSLGARNWLASRGSKDCAQRCEEPEHVAPENLISRSELCFHCGCQRADQVLHLSTSSVCGNSRQCW